MQARRSSWTALESRPRRTPPALSPARSEAHAEHASGTSAAAASISFKVSVDTQQQCWAEPRQERSPGSTGGEHRWEGLLRKWEAQVLRTLDRMGERGRDECCETIKHTTHVIA